MVVLFDENTRIVELYDLVRDQVTLSSMGEVISLNHLAIMNMLELFHIEDRLKTFMGVLECFRVDQETYRESHTNA